MDSRRDSNDGLPQIDEELEQTLKNFQSGVHAWSEAAYSQPHKPVKIARASWRIAASWALGGSLAVGSLMGVIYERRHQQVQANIAAAESARQQKLDAEQRKDNEDLLAKVDSDVSREVPSAMEPLAQLMVEDSEQ